MPANSQKFKQHTRSRSLQEALLKAWMDERKMYIYLGTAPVASVATIAMLFVDPVALVFVGATSVSLVLKKIVMRLVTMRRKECIRYRDACKHSLAKRFGKEITHDQIASEVPSSWHLNQGFKASFRVALATLPFLTLTDADVFEVIPGLKTAFDYLQDAMLYPAKTILQYSTDQLVSAVRDSDVVQNAIQTINDHPAVKVTKMCNSAVSFFNSALGKVGVDIPSIDLYDEQAMIACLEEKLPKAAEAAQESVEKYIAELDPNNPPSDEDVAKFVDELKSNLTTTVTDAVLEGTRGGIKDIGPVKSSIRSVVESSIASSTAAFEDEIKVAIVNCTSAVTSVSSLARWIDMFGSIIHQAYQILRKSACKEEYMSYIRKVNVGRNVPGQDPKEGLCQHRWNVVEKRTNLLNRPYHRVVVYRNKNEAREAFEANNGPVLLFNESLELEDKKGCTDETDKLQCLLKLHESWILEEELGAKK